MPTVEEQVVALLSTEWQEGLHITTIPQALARLGLPDDEETRWRIGRLLERAWEKRRGASGMWHGLRLLRGATRRNPTAWLPVLRRLPSLVAEARAWSPAVYILSNEEKLIARHVLRAGRVPSVEEIGAALGLSSGAVETGLRMLRRLGFLAGVEGGHRFAPGHERLLAGLGFNFHTVALEGGEQFNVPCAIDFLLLVSSQYANQRVIIADACAHCTDRIRLVFDRGELMAVTPPETYVYRGGG